MPYTPKHVIDDIATIRAMQPNLHPTQPAKILDRIDDLCRLWIERSTFLTLATFGADGTVDVSPKGDPAGFVKVLDDKTLAIPDRPGNHRYDGFQNIMETGRIGLVFLVPHRSEVVRINGRAQVIRDLPVREACAIKGRVPDFAILTHVEEAFYHCGKAIIRSRLWSPDQAGSTEGLPTYAEALKAHAQVDLSLEDIAERMAHNDANRLYDE